MKRSICATAGAFLLALSLFPSTAFSVLYIDINAPGGKRMPIAVADVALGRGDPSLSRDIPKILSDDLALTDLFDLVPPTAHMETVTGAHFSGKPLSFPGWKMIGAEAVVIGLADVRGDQLSLEMRLYDATQGTLLLGKRYTGTPNQLRSIVHRFANEIVYTFTGVRGVFGTEIAFTARSGKSRGKELYIVGMDGQDLRKVTDNRSFNLFPRWSPDGQWLAYTSFRTGSPAVYLRNVSTGAEKEVVRTGGSKAPGGFSPDGVWLYAGVSQSGNSDIYRVRVVGGASEKVVEGWGLDVSPAPSPDGRRIAFVSDRGGSPQIYVKTIGVAGERRGSPPGQATPRRRPGPPRETGSPTPSGPVDGSSWRPSHPTDPGSGKSPPRRMATAKTRPFPPTAAPWFTRTGKGTILPSKSSRRTAGDSGHSFPALRTPVHPPGHPDGSLEGADAPGCIH